METVICIVIATLVAVGMISNLIDSAVETVRKNTAQQFQDFTREVEYMFERHETSMTNRLSNLATTMGYTLSTTDPSVKDVLLFDVAELAITIRGISTSSVQRHFSVSYSRAGKIIDQLYGLGVCGKAQENGVRPLLITMAELYEMNRAGTFN